MSIGAALQGAISGFDAGVAMRHKWQDREDDKARQKRLDEINDAREKRAQEAHTLNLEGTGLLNDARRRDIKAWDQEWSDGQSIRDARGEADRAVMANLGAVRDAPAPLAPATVSTSGGNSLLEQQIADAQRAATMPALGAIRPAERKGDNITSPAPQVAMAGRAEAAPEVVAAATAPALGAIRRPEPPGLSPIFDDRAQAIAEHRSGQLPPMGAIRPAPAGMATDLLRIRPDGTYVANREPRTNEEKRALFEAAKAGKLATSPARAAKQREIDANTALDMPYSWGEDGRVPEHLDRLGRLGRRAANGALATVGEKAINGIVATGKAFTDPLDRAFTYVTGRDAVNLYGRVDLDGDGRKMTILSPLADGWGAIRSEPQPKGATEPAQAAAETPPAAAEVTAPPASASPQEKQVAASAAEAMDTPDAKATLAQMPALGATRGTPLTKGQVEKFSTDYEAEWRRTGLPIMQRAYLKLGKFDEAEKLAEWAQSGAARKGAQAWSMGTILAQSGNLTGAASAWIDAYNAPGYYNDGYEILKEQSEILKDDRGREVGARITFRNQATGETHESVIEAEDLGETFGKLLMPTEAFAASQERLKAQQEALLKFQEEQAGMGRRLVEANYTQTIGMTKEIFAKDAARHKAEMEAAFGDPAAQERIRPPVTWDEAMAEAQRLMTEGPRAAPAEGAGAAPPPVVRRPQ